jgi:hypothetical protein
MDADLADPWRDIHERGDAQLALAFARLYWLAFVERRGCVLIEHRAVEEAISTWLEHSSGDTQQVEGMLNHVHLWDQLPADQSELDDEALMEVGRTIVRCWHAALAEQFPGRAFEINLVGPDDDYGPTIYLTSVPDSQQSA